MILLLNSEMDARDYVQLVTYGEYHAAEITDQARTWVDRGGIVVEDRISKELGNYSGVLR